MTWTCERCGKEQDNSNCRCSECGGLPPKFKRREYNPEDGDIDKKIVDEIWYQDLFEPDFSEPSDPMWDDDDLLSS